MLYLQGEIMTAKKHKGLRILKHIVRFFLVPIIIILNIYIYFFLFVELREFPYLYVLMQILGVVFVLEIYNNNQNISYKLTWTIFILAIPFSGAMFYLLFGGGKTIPNRKNRKIIKYMEDKIPQNDLIDEIDDKVTKKLCRHLYENTKFPLYKNTNQIFISDGKKKFDMMFEELNKAQDFIFMEYFIVSRGEIFNKLKDILLKKAEQGVKIKFIYDAVGSGGTLRKKDLEDLKNHQNISIVPYNPLGYNISLAINYRDHRKICIVDGRVCFVGGINLADEYANIKNRFGHWRDNALMIEGDAVKSYMALFSINWYMSTKEPLSINSYENKHDIINDNYVFPFGDGPTNDLNPTYSLFFDMISNANEYIYISTPYLIIDKVFIQALSSAAKSGVDVRILLPHIPDKKLVFKITQSHYGKLLEDGVKIYEFEPGFNHAKNIIVDGKYGYVGTSNIDYRSMFLHFECGNFMVDDKCIKDIYDNFIEDLDKSILIDCKTWKKRSIFSKMLGFILQIVSPLL